jgi:1,2-dihydroxy-3-keto-5-methylthiopentene dioxygenase
MSILKLSSGKILENTSEIQQELACLSIQIENYNLNYNLGHSVDFGDCLTGDVLSYAEKEQIIQSYQSYFESNAPQSDRFCYDLLVVHPGSPSLYSLTATYSRYHTHVDAETLHVLSGEAIFGFVKPDGSQIELLLQPYDYIRIPSGCEHCFSLAASLQFKAVRYFSTADGWMPQHTGRIQLDN